MDSLDLVLWSQKGRRAAAARGKGGGTSWSSYWATLISATVENAAPTHVVLTFPTAKTILGATDFTIAGFTISSASWAGAVLTLVTNVGITYFRGNFNITFVKTGTTATVTNNVADDTNTVAWFDSSDLTTLTKATGTTEAVSLWKDKLLSGHDLAQVTGILQPIWSSNGILFDGISQFMKCATFPLVQPITVYALITQLSYTAGDRLWDGHLSDTMNITQWQNSPEIEIYLGVAELKLDNGTNVIGTTQVITAIYNGLTSLIQADNKAAITGNVGVVDSNGFTLGTIGGFAGGWSHILVKEIIIRDVADTAQDRVNIYNYLNYKKLSFLNDFDNILVLGNSITVHPIAAYWWGEWGMAASIQANDFVHKLQTKIRLNNPACVVEPANIYLWEQAHATYDLSNLDPYFTTPRDLVIIRLGENISDETDLATSFQSLITYIKSKTSAKIVITGVFWTDASKDATLSAAAVANGLPYVELSSLDVAGNKSSIGATVYDAEGNPHLVDNAGVASHPNDAGMLAIANKIYAMIS